MADTSSDPVTKADMQDLLAEQSKIILGAVDERFEKKTEDLKRHMGVVAESLRFDIRVVAEGVEVANQCLDRLEPIVEKVEKIEDDVEVIKVTAQGIKYDLKGKADREELSALEAKLRPA